MDVKPIISRPPSLCMKPAQTPPAGSPPAPSPTATLSLTSREWVIPPRPKPGRKPATDTPPTKRKAQNRAAQRAFRERRAARVGELEEQIKLIEDEHERQQDALNNTVERLETEIDQYRADLVNWVDRCRRLENELAVVKSAHTSSAASSAAASSSSSTTTTTSSTTITSSSSSPLSKTNESTSSTGQPQSTPAAHDADLADTSVGCGNCTLETRCQCIDDAFHAMTGQASGATSLQEKRPRSPLMASTDKRIKLEPKDSLEIDFTSAYVSKPRPSASRQENVSRTSAVADPCGFCSDGTPCICAEMAAEQEQAQAMSDRPRAATDAGRPPIHQLAQFTPPPSEGDVSISILATAPSNTGCASGPGTCAQCQADPNSTLFCKTLAASRAQSAGTPQGCCGGQTANGTCCLSLPPPSRTTRSRTAAQSRSQKASVTLTCADAYTTLSRHPAYERASGEIATWMPKLHASDAAKTIEGRPALEIDAANVMAVLKDFDRRFGQSR